MMNDQHKYLEYYVPTLGRRINARLYSNAAKCHDLLKMQGHIDLMKRIEQLGVISNIYKTAFHSRWEYVMVHLHLIHRLNEEEKGLGLGSNKKYGNYEASGIEILQIWVLLFNAGHLPGTFASERAILRFLKKEENIKKAFMDGLPQNQKIIGEKLNKLIEQRNTYPFHRILSSFTLEGYKKDFSKSRNICKRSIENRELENPKFIDFLQETISLYEKREEKQLIDIFKKLRLISYLFLDSQHIKFPISFDLSEILLNFPEYIQGLIKEPDSQIIKTLESFEDFLSVNVYHSADSIREMGHHASKVKEKLNKNKEKLNKTTELRKFLKKESNFKPEIKKWGNYPNFHILFDFSHPDFMSKYKFVVETFNEDLCKIEEDLNEKYGANCLLTYQQGPNHKHLAVNLSFYSASEKENIKSINYLLEEFISFYTKSISEKNSEIKNLIETVLKKPYLDLVTSLLKYIVKKELFFEFKDNYPEILIIENGNSIDKCIKTIEEEKNKEELSSRKHELTVLIKVLKKEKESLYTTIIPLSQLSVYDYTQKPDKITTAEIDGFGLMVKNGTLRALLVEAKDMDRGSTSESEKQLCETLENLGFKTAMEPDECLKEIEGGAYCCLKIDGTQE